jgi:hypothetical protein
MDLRRRDAAVLLGFGVTAGEIGATVLSDTAFAAVARYVARAASMKAARRIATSTPVPEVSR